MRALLLAAILAIPAFGDLPEGSNPGPIAPTGKAVDAKTPLRVGQVLQVAWGGQWWAARVLAVRKDGAVRIRYLGWAKSWDAVVKRSRLALDADAEKKAKKTIRNRVVLQPPKVQQRPQPQKPKPKGKYWNPGSLKPSGRQVTRETDLRKGDYVLARSGNHWYGARVLEVLKRDLVRIHWVGWHPKYDTILRRADLQLDSNPPSIIDRPPQ